MYSISQNIKPFSYVLAGVNWHTSPEVSSAVPVHLVCRTGPQSFTDTSQCIFLWCFAFDLMPRIFFFQGRKPRFLKDATK